MAFRYLSMALIPLFTGYAVYALWYNEYKVRAGAVMSPPAGLLRPAGAHSLLPAS